MENQFTNNPDPEPIERFAWTKKLVAGAKKGLFVAVPVLFAFLGVYLYSIFFPSPIPPTQDEINQGVNQMLASATPEPPYSTTVYQIILPSLVFIQIEGEDVDGEKGYGIGSGVVVNENGDILTAYHVIAGASKIEVFFVDGSKSTAEVVIAEPENDIALLHPAELPELVVPAVLGSAGGMRVGDQAFAVGNPLGFVASMSAGVISGFDRTINVEEESGEISLDGLIQFDTAVNPGSSGGPLLNRYGQVVGIVTGIANPSDEGFFTGIGFAVPIGTAVAVGGGGPGY